MEDKIISLYKKGQGSLKVKNHQASLGWNMEWNSDLYTNIANACN